MRALRALRVLVISLLLAGLAQPALARGRRPLAFEVARKLSFDGWLEIRSPLFEIATDADRERGLELAKELSTWIAVLGLVSNVRDFRPRVPLRIYLFREQAAYNAFRARNAAGQTHPTPRGLFVLMSPEGRPAREILFHEYVHFLLRNSGSMSYPVWYDEGFAELLAGTRMLEHLVTIGSIPDFRLGTLKREPLLPLEKVLSARAYSDLGDKLGVFYAQSWLLVHYLHAGDQLGYPKRHAQMLSYLAKLNALGDWRAAYDASFDVGLEGLQEELTSYGEKITSGGLVPRLRIDVRKLAVEASGEASPIAPGQVAFELGQLFLDAEKAGAPYAEKLFELALERDASHAGALAGLGRAHALRGDLREAETPIRRAAELAPDDPLVSNARGELLFLRSAERSDDDDPEQAGVLLEQARASYRRAIELAPEGPVGHVNLGRTYLDQPGDVAPGIAALRRACSLLPWSTGVRLQLGRLHAQADQPWLARAQLERVLRWSEGDEAKQAERLLGSLPAGPGEPPRSGDGCASPG